MSYVLALLAAVNWGVMPASSEECELGVSMASLKTYTVGSTVGSAQHRPEPDKTALVKEGEFESPETIAAIEKNREDRERTVVMNR